jgi:predicted nucleotidyltransferase
MKGTDKHNGIAGALFGKTRLAVITILYTHPEEPYYLRRLVREAGVGLGGVQRETMHLATAGVITRVEKDNQVYFQANRECAVFNEIRSIVVKTAGLGDVLRSALEGLGDAINLAFVYGSMARGNDRAGSDVDLLVVGDAEYKKVNSELVQAQKILGREINPTVFPPEEFRKKAKAGSHFLSTVLKDKKIFIKGNEHELARLAE